MKLLVFFAFVIICSALEVSYTIQSESGENFLDVVKNQRIQRVCTNQTLPNVYLVSRKGDAVFLMQDFFDKYGYFASVCIDQATVCSEITSAIALETWDDFFLVIINPNVPTLHHIAEDFHITDVNFCTF